MLYRIAQRKDAFIANVLGGQNGFINCDIHFTHPGLEVGEFTFFLCFIVFH